MGLSQRAVAEKLGCSQSKVSRLENLDDLGLETLRKYIAALGGKTVLTFRLNGRTHEVELQ